MSGNRSTNAHQKQPQVKQELSPICNRKICVSNEFDPRSLIFKNAHPSMRLVNEKAIRLEQSESLVTVKFPIQFKFRREVNESFLVLVSHKIIP